MGNALAGAVRVVVAATAVLAFAWYAELGPVVAGLASMATPGCTIKGNISINTGERIYHVPGQEWYAETRISPMYGERWFCSEAEARAAGWRRARG